MFRKLFKRLKCKHNNDKLICTGENSNFTFRFYKCDCCGRRKTESEKK